MINDLKKGEHGTDLYTEQKFGDCNVELELMIPKGSNSGIYLMGEYEVQVLDSYGKEKVGPGDMGGDLQHRRPEEERLQEARRVADVRHRLPGPALRRTARRRPTPSS